SGASLRCARGRAGRRLAPSLVGAGVRQAHELSMQTQVAAQLGMKTERDDASVPHRHRMTVVIRHHVNVSGAFDQRSAAANARKRLSVATADVKWRLEAVDLAAVSVATPAAVEY